MAEEAGKRMNGTRSQSRGTIESEALVDEIHDE